MKKRLIIKKDIKKAYSQDLQIENENIKFEEEKPDIDKLPDEIFEILGEVVSFIEVTNKLEENKNENK